MHTHTQKVEGKTKKSIQDQWSNVNSLICVWTIRRKAKEKQIFEEIMSVNMYLGKLTYINEL